MPCEYERTAVSGKGAKWFRSWRERSAYPVLPAVVVASVTTIGGREGNGRRGRDNDIRRLGRNGASIALIVRGAGVSEPTVRKYLRKPGLSDRPGLGRVPESPLFESFAGLVDSFMLCQAEVSI